jgi:23S rRNA pseudouridine1911/1915/1917 synthase
VIRSPAPLPPELTPGVLFEDQHLIVVDKPAGLLSQGEKKGDPNLVDWLRERVQRDYVGLVHRLDRNTSGAMVVAKRTKSAQRLTEALQAGEIHRSYLAWVHGQLSAQAHWRHRLLKDQRTNVVQVVSPTHPQGKDAALRVTPLETGMHQGQPVTLVEFVLETGRSHQIRVQAAKEGYPLLGDRKYATAKTPPGSAAFGRPALHSYLIRFPHPMGGAVAEYIAPLPADMEALRRA